MQFGDSDNRHHQPREISCYSSGATCFLSHRFNKLFRSPLTFVLLIWGLLFMILGVTLVYGQDTGHAPIQQHTTQR